MPNPTQLSTMAFDVTVAPNPEGSFRAGFNEGMVQAFQQSLATKVRRARIRDAHLHINNRAQTFTRANPERLTGGAVHWVSYDEAIRPVEIDPRQEHVRALRMEAEHRELRRRWAEEVAQQAIEVRQRRAEFQPQYRTFYEANFPDWMWQAPKPKPRIDAKRTIRQTHDAYAAKSQASRTLSLALSAKNSAAAKPSAWQRFAKHFGIVA